MNGKITNSHENIISELANLLPRRDAAIYLLSSASDSFELMGQSGSESTFNTEFVFDELFADHALPGADEVVLTDDSNFKHRLLNGSDGTDGSPAMGIGGLYFDKQLKGFLFADIPSDTEQAIVKSEFGTTLRIIQLLLAQDIKLQRLENNNAFYQSVVIGSNQLNLSDTTDHALQAIIAAAESSTKFDRLTISMRRSDTDDALVVRGISGKSAGLSVGEQFDPEGTIHGEVFLRNKVISSTDMTNDNFAGRFAKGDFSSTNMKSFIGVPIVEAGVCLGVLAIECSKADNYGSDDVEYMVVIGQVYGTAFCWSNRYQEVHSLATIDGLTSLVNSRSFIQRMGEEIERDVRYGIGMSMLMLDIDEFKKVNDTFGHPYGDYVIRQTAKLIRDSIRTADVAGRLGGEEFGVIIINSDSAASRKTAERIKQSIADYHFENEGIQSRITISVGMSEYPTDGKDVKEIMKHADDAMYHVKHSGGNGVITFSEI